MTTTTSRTSTPTRTSTPPSSSPSPADLAAAAPAEIRAERTFNALVIGVVVVGFLALLAMGATGAAVLGRNLNYTAWVTHTYQVDTAIADFRSADERLETARRGFLLSHDERFAAGIGGLERQSAAQVEAIGRMTLDNPIQQANVAALRRMVAEQIRAVDVSIAFARAGANDSSRFFQDTGTEATRQIRARADAMQAEEKRLLDLRNAERLRSVNRLFAIAVGAGLLLLAMAIGSVVVILRYTRALAGSRRALYRLNLGLEDQVEARTAELRRANDEIQRFAYIVSHDLRAPLVNIMGFTSELEVAAGPLAGLLERAEAEAPQIVAPGARDAIRTDLPESLGFIRTSTRKMDRLINAILQLSRQGRRVLAPETVDVVALAKTVAASLAHRTGELGAEIIVAPDIPPVFSDRLALEQIFSNLMENALKYLQPGRAGRIEISGSLQDGRVVYEVADNGRGIDPKDHDRVFDLFRRAGMQDQPGEGIGLAHVRALAYRLGGRIGVDSTLDHGATFRLSLPLRLSTGE